MKTPKGTFWESSFLSYENFQIKVLFHADLKIKVLFIKEIKLKRIEKENESLHSFNDGKSQTRTKNA